MAEDDKQLGNSRLCLGMPNITAVEVWMFIPRQNTGKGITTVVKLHGFQKKRLSLSKRKARSHYHLPTITNEELSKGVISKNYFMGC